MQEIYKVNTRPEARKENMVTGEKYRITMLTEGLVRLEYSETGEFEDRATQLAFYRDFPETDYRVIHTEDGIEIHTSRLHLIYNEKEFTSWGLSIQVKGNFSAYHSIWRFGEPIHDLKGTARTLDEADGAIPLEHGVVSRFGYSLLDDSRSQVLLEDGWLEPRKKGIQDLYFFGYGHDYKEALKDLYTLCGRPPMIPRYALGNWWSRFYPYSEESYLALMDRFKEEDLPFTVAVIDTDWHPMDIDPKYGSGWTGYTWNRELFPDPPRFLKALHDRGMKVTLNVHPAEGVKAHEEMYQEMAAAMGVDAAHEDPVNCDLADPKFLENYFSILHRPREKEGVDFWWIDWQQGTNCKVEGLDPLWILNHYHFLDNGRDGKRPMIFSRYAGPGSHRYPVGFSGDTLITWESLDFQPYFTSTASNIGYGWWSHDIGGHMLGYKNDELETRWVQYGIYSPITRLHSSRSEFNGKEPWRYKKEAEMAMGEALRERHRLMPYLYTMNARSYEEGLPLVLPLYYEYPEQQEAYAVKNQYLFGSQLMVAPITSPRIPSLNVAKTTAWLPQGRWYDLYTGMMYDGGRMLNLYRDLNSIPVFARAGAILPLTDEIDGAQARKNPESLRFLVFSGEEGSFVLYEDDNETCDYEKGLCVRTHLYYEENENLVSFTVDPAQGQLSLIPHIRTYTVDFAGFTREAAEDGQVKAFADGKEIPVSVSYDEKKQTVRAALGAVPVTAQVRLCMKSCLKSSANHVEQRCFDFLNQAEIDFRLKDQIYGLIVREKRVPAVLAQLDAMNISAELKGVISEILTAGTDR